MNLIKQITLSLIFLFFVSCKTESAKKEVDETYASALDSYVNEKTESRKSGYLQLAGLFRFKDDVTTFGKDGTNTFPLNIESLPHSIGTFTNTDEALVFETSSDVMVKNANDSIITKIPLVLDEYGSSMQLFHDRLKWQVITRSERLYLRVWDVRNPAIEAFKGFKCYSINPDLIFDAQFIYFDKAKSEEVKSQLGVNASTEFIGKVSFEYNGTPYSLDVGNSGFTMVSDETSGDETYGGGRYVYLDLPESDGPVKLDFNLLYNPPCSFSEYTTCLYPPRQNYLSIKILAGETIERF